MGLNQSKISCDVVIVGSGPTGALMAQRLSRSGFRVVILDAGQRFAGPTALQNTESNAAKIMWSEPRNFVGSDFVIPKTGTGVGGGSLTWLGVMPRFHPADFRTFSTEGVGSDWPIGYDDLRSYYSQIENEFGLAGECGPYAPEAYQLPMPPHRMNWHGQVLARGAIELGARPFAPPIAINSTERDGRPACIYCGWCASGCPTEAKATSANTYLPKAVQQGTRVISEAFVHRIDYDRNQSRVSGIVYLDSQGREHLIEASLVVLAAHAIETPRLLLLSSNPSFPNGLANSSGMVGKNLMSHPTWQVFGVFDEPIQAYRGMQMGHVMVQDYYSPIKENSYQRGYVLLSYMMTPATYANLGGLSFGQDLKDYLYDYPNTAAWWAHAEGLPHAHNTVELDDQLCDARGLPSARVKYQWGENDQKLVEAARDKAAEMMRASGAKKVRIGLQYGAHAMGSCRMGSDPKTSVTNSFGQSHDVKNLFVCDTSLFVTGSGLNPTLTAMAIASRSADYIVREASKELR